MSKTWNGMEWNKEYSMEYRNYGMEYRKYGMEYVDKKNMDVQKGM
jgi:hypothetical protein